MMMKENTLGEFWQGFHKFNVERVGGIRVVLNVEHIEMAFLSETFGGFELWYIGSRIFRHQDLPGDCDEIRASSSRGRTRRNRTVLVVLKVNMQSKRIAHVGESDEAEDEVGEVERLPREDWLSLSMFVGNEAMDKGIS